MKIVGGKIIPGTNAVGAYVAAIFPGGVADQLHGELQEGESSLTSCTASCRKVSQLQEVKLSLKSYTAIYRKKK